MKNSKLALLVSGMALSVISCQKEEVPVNLEAPKVTLELSGKAEKLYNEVTLSSTATDKGSIEKVEFFLNDQRLGEDSEAPYELQWNSKDVEDGHYTLKAIAHAATGLKAEAAQDVRVKNTLLVMNIENDYLQAEEGKESDRWIFLSDKNGNVIGDPQQLTNGASLNWQRPMDFNSDTVYFNNLSYYSAFYEWDAKPQKYLQVSTYSNFALEEINLKAYGYTAREHAGDATITIENEFDGAEYRYRTNIPHGGSGAFSRLSPVTYDVRMFNETTKGFSTYEINQDIEMSRESKYYRLDDLQVGNTHTFHTSDFAPMEKITMSLPNTYSYFSAWVAGYLNQDDERYYRVDNRYFRNKEGDDVRLFYADDFSLFYTSISIENEGNRYYTNMKGKAPASYSFPEYSAAVTGDDFKDIMVTARGTFDVASAFWSKEIDDETQYYRIRRKLYFNSESGQNYSMPDIPASLLELYPELNSELTYSFVWVADNENLTSYDEMMAYWFTDRFADSDLRAYSTAYLYPSADGARKLPEHNKLSPEELQKRENLRASGAFMH